MILSYFLASNNDCDFDWESRMEEEKHHEDSQMNFGLGLRFGVPTPSLIGRAM
jgi:hypothetical protein